MSKERLLKTIISPHISEKATIIAELNNQYIFRVNKTSTKSEIKDAVELIFNTRVEKVCIVNVKSKERMFRGRKGKKKAWKKAYVTLHGDQKLDIVGA
jgi:large subunit ribosomal protein L23